MKVEFKIVEHSLKNEKVVEVFIDGHFKAAIYPGEGKTKSIRVMSAHVTNTRQEDSSPHLTVSGKLMKGWEFIFD